ncbi:hypothetical protein [Methylobacterium oryzisoli]|uniref:hypothetical protein n=1 Tax=Methylobacterium oryzisoli TaxID=3385502 RepID=UPI0038922E96
MIRTSLALGCGALLLTAAAVVTPASAAPAVPTIGLSGESMVETVASRREMVRARDMRSRRMMRRNSMRSGDSNARNPSRPGYQQQLGNTSGGPRR